MRVHTPGPAARPPGHDPRWGEHTTTKWYKPDGRPATADEAQRLLLDIPLRLLAQDTVRVGEQVAVVSTWFTVIDHGLRAGGRPLLWETVVSSPSGHSVLGHYATPEQAAQGHSDALTLVSYRMQRTADPGGEFAR